MNKRFLSILLVLVVSTGCQPSDQTANRNGTSQQNASQLETKTVGSVTLNPVRVIPTLEMLVPEGFSKMDEAKIKVKYPAANRPSLVYTNSDGTVNIAVNNTQNKVAPSQLEQLHQQLDSSIRQAQPTAKWMFSGFQHYHGRKWTQLEFQSQAVDTVIHNMMMATSAKGKMLAVSFNCTEENAETWLPVGREIIKSAIVSE